MSSILRIKSPQESRPSSHQRCPPSQGPPCSGSHKSTSSPRGYPVDGTSRSTSHSSHQVTEVWLVHRTSWIEPGHAAKACSKHLQHPIKSTSLFKRANVPFKIQPTFPNKFPEAFHGDTILTSNVNFPETQSYSLCDGGCEGHCNNWKPLLSSFILAQRSNNPPQTKPSQQNIEKIRKTDWKPHWKTTAPLPEWARKPFPAPCSSQRPERRARCRRSSPSRRSSRSSFRRQSGPGVFRKRYIEQTVVKTV